MAFLQLPHILAIFILIQNSFVSAYWRLACSVSQEARLDPVISSGTISTHVHKFAGGINIGASSTGQSLQQSSCSTCQVQNDKSAYWTPSLYYQHPDGTFESVPNDGMTVYYVGRGGTPSNTRPFPPGFSMISGNPRLRDYDTTTTTYNNIRPIADRVSFRCINEANNLLETHYIDQTNTNCVNGLRAQLNFQSCWDGENLYLENNAHVAYLSGIDYGDCPPTHPVPIPGLFYEVLYWVNDINQQPGGQFVLSNGDPTGFGFHGDFVNAWNQDVLTSAVQDCLYTDNGGVVTACPALVPSNDVNFARDCLQAPDPVSEPVYGNLTRLPGCNPVTTDENTIPSCSSGNTTLVSSSAVTSSISSTTSSLNTHPPLLTTASIPLVVTTLTTFVTVTLPISSATTSSPSISTPTVAATISTDISVAVSTSDANNPISSPTRTFFSRTRMPPRLE